MWGCASLVGEVTPFACAEWVPLDPQSISTATLSTFGCLGFAVGLLPFLWGWAVAIINAAARKV